MYIIFCFSSLNIFSVCVNYRHQNISLPHIVEIYGIDTFSVARHVYCTSLFHVTVRMDDLKTLMVGWNTRPIVTNTRKIPF